MKSRKLREDPDIYMLVSESGDDLIAELVRFAADNRIHGASFGAIGALSKVRLGACDPRDKSYQTAAAFDEQVELASLGGDIGVMGDKPVLHIHAVIGRSDGRAFAGHILDATVNPTCELFLTAFRVDLPKVHSDRFDLNLFDLG